MIDFKEEISKYKRAILMEEVEASVYNEELKDVMDMLTRLTDKLVNDDEVARG